MFLIRLQSHIPIWELCKRSTYSKQSTSLLACYLSVNTIPSDPTNRVVFNKLSATVVMYTWHLSRRSLVHTNTNTRKRARTHARMRAYKHATLTLTLTSDARCGDGIDTASCGLCVCAVADRPFVDALVQMGQQQQHRMHYVIYRLKSP